MGVVGLLALGYCTTSWGAGHNLDDRYGWYIAGSGGWTNASDLKTDGDPSEGDIELPEFDLTLDPGYAAQLSVGTMFGAWRAEVEVGYRRNEVSDVQVNGQTATTSGNGDISALTFAVNGIYDIPIVDRLGAYIGGGGGVGMLDGNIRAETSDGARYELDDSAAGVVLQFMAGLDLKVSDQLHLTAGYRMWVLLSANVSVNTNGDSNTVLIQNDQGIDPLLMHTLEIGLRYEF